ncbi:MAG: radical SAM protein [Candidatus Aenigmarchaeota archaeon]|nr:radical SAM protein [Candidatus Aenigmarchaeota archaeon]MDI6722365.1 radical SAM protein [Candidatus Aenigmarchaeota archaeon]
MKIVFIDPKGVWEGLNNGIAYIDANIRKDHDVKVVDFVNREGNEDKRLECVKDADYVGLSIKSFTLDESVRLALKIKKMNPGAKIIAGGPHIMVDGINFMKDNRGFDIAIRGEAELASREILEKPFSEVDGTIYRENGEVKENCARKWIADLDNLKFPDYDSFDSVNYDGEIHKIDKWPLVTSRGCPYSCSYCNVPVVIGRKFRTRSGENIIKELRYAKEKYGCTEFKVLDDNFTLLMDRAKDVCRLFIEEKLNMKWTCPNGIRADRLDDELCELMVKAGCYSVSIGVESGDPEVFRKINKGEKLEDVERGILTAKRAGLKVHGFFILGLVGSTYEADKRSMDFVKKVGLDSASWGILVPYPGTEVWNQVRSDPNVRMLRDWKEGFHIGARPKPVFDTQEYPAEQRIKAFYLANMKFTKARDYPRAAKMVIKSLLAGK